MKTRTPRASLLLKGQVTEHTTVKWTIGLGKKQSQPAGIVPSFCLVVQVDFLIPRLDFEASCNSAPMFDRVVEKQLHKRPIRFKLSNRSDAKNTIIN